VGEKGFHRPNVWSRGYYWAAAIIFPVKMTKNGHFFLYFIEKGVFFNKNRWHPSPNQIASVYN